MQQHSLCPARLTVAIFDVLDTAEFLRHLLVELQLALLVDDARRTVELVDHFCVQLVQLKSE